MATALSDKERTLIDAYWRAANYLAVGQIYLYDNPLLKQPLSKDHIKPRLLGHWGTTPGLNFLYAHLNRVIKKHDLDMIYVTGPGHGGPALVANAYLEGTYSEVYPNISTDEAGMKRLFTQFSFPGGIPSHVAPETPGSIHEGGELGYARSHAYGSADPAPQRLQDRQSHHPGPHQPRGTGAALSRLWLHPAFRRGRRPGKDARAHGRHIGDGHRRNPPHQGERAAGGRRTPALADDRAPHAQGLDLPQGNRRKTHRGLLACAPGADGRDARKAGARAHPRTVDEELPAGRAVRRGRTAAARARRTAAAGRSPHERQSAHQRRPAAARPPASRFPRLCGEGWRPGRHHGRVDADHGRLPARCHEAQHATAQLPPLQPRREQLQPLAGRSRGHQPRLAGGNLSV